MAHGRSKSSNGTSSASSGAGGGAASFVANTARVRGRVLGEGDLTIEGQVEGDITLRGDLTVASGGSAKSNVEAESVIIAGSLEGDVSARGPVRILASAHVRGNLTGAEVSVEEGAQFAGNLDCEFEMPAELSGTASARRRA